MNSQFIELTSIYHKGPVEFNINNITFITVDEGNTCIFTSDGKRVAVRETYDNVKNLLSHLEYLDDDI